MKTSIFIGRDDLKEKLGEEFPDVSFTVVEREAVWQLDAIVCETRNQGRGTDFMNRLCSLADAHDRKVVLTPDLSFGASSVKRLTRFYKRFGFIENAGRKRDYAVSHSMMRHPNLTN